MVAYCGVKCQASDYAAHREMCLIAGNGNKREREDEDDMGPLMNKMLHVLRKNPVNAEHWANVMTLEQLREMHRTTGGIYRHLYKNSLFWYYVLRRWVPNLVPGPFIPGTRYQKLAMFQTVLELYIEIGRFSDDLSIVRLTGPESVWLGKFDHQNTGDIILTGITLLDLIDAGGLSSFLDRVDASFIFLVDGEFPDENEMEYTYYGGDGDADTTLEGRPTLKTILDLDYPEPLETIAEGGTIVLNLFANRSAPLQVHVSLQYPSELQPGRWDMNVAEWLNDAYGARAHLPDIREINITLSTSTSLHTAMSEEDYAGQLRAAMPQYFLQRGDLDRPVSEDEWEVVVTSTFGLEQGPPLVYPSIADVDWDFIDRRIQKANRDPEERIDIQIRRK